MSLVRSPITTPIQPIRRVKLTLLLKYFHPCRLVQWQNRSKLVLLLSLVTTSSSTSNLKLLGLLFVEVKPLLIFLGRLRNLGWVIILKAFDEELRKLGLLLFLSSLQLPFCETFFLRPILGSIELVSTFPFIL